MTRRMAFDLIEAEFERALLLHPVWPDDRIYQAAIVAEEAGEALQAALNLREGDPHFDGATVTKLREEWVQTGAMVLRALVNLK